MLNNGCFEIRVENPNLFNMKNEDHLYKNPSESLLVGDSEGFGSKTIKTK